MAGTEGISRPRFAVRYTDVFAAADTIRAAIADAMRHPPHPAPQARLEQRMACRLTNDALSRQEGRAAR